jgi:hypothetical protein
MEESVFASVGLFAGRPPLRLNSSLLSFPSESDIVGQSHSKSGSHREWDEIAGFHDLTEMMSRSYPEKKWIKERNQQRKKIELNRAKEISILAWNTTERTPNIPRSGWEEKIAERRIHKTD